MNNMYLEDIKDKLGIKTLKVLCTGEMKVDYADLKELQILEDGRSLKDTDDESITKLAESLLRFGIVNNLQIWIDKSGEIYCFDAHHRKKALALLDEIGLKIPKLPATRCLAKSRSEAKKLLLLKESRSSWVNQEVLPDYLSEINFSTEIAAATITLPDFEWDIQVGIEKHEKEKAENIPEIDEQSIVIEKGDLIELGEHRLLCGDATVEEDVERLIDGIKVDMVFTDPPYGIDIVKSNRVGGGGGYAYGGVKETGKIGGGNIVSSKTYKKIKGDQTTEVAGKFYQCCLDMGLENIVLWGGNYFTDFLPPSRCWFVWDKEMTGNFSEAEMAWTSFEKGGVRLFKFLWNGLSREGSRDEELKKRIHPTQKPVGLFIMIFDKFEKFEVVLDGFLGSGTTLIACEKTGRRCFGMEIDPGYCQVVVQRYVDFTGNDQVEINGDLVSWEDFKQD